MATLTNPGADPPRHRVWWQGAVVYEIYPRSFADADGDGVGDLRGVVAHLDHLASGPGGLGVDAIWLTPFYPSGGVDGGYDVTDYCQVDPAYGTLEDFDHLVAQAHRSGLRVIVDWVPNHTSDRHPWFVEARASREAPGVDAVGIAGFADAERDNLYKLWNRMSSGSYLPGPVRAVEIPKDHGAGVRVLGVPNVADRVAQTAAAMLLEEKLEPIFHPDSYGYRPGRSARDALAVARRRCWRQDWIVDLDIRAFFDSVDYDLLLKAVAHHTDERWVLLYIARWLSAPMQMPDGTLVAREKGTPQGSPISPLLANLFMHYAFDTWMAREFPGCPFERYADDIVAHCDTERQAHRLRAAIADRLGALGLELHPEKTKVVYCKDTNRAGEAEHTSFDFLGYTFRDRMAKGRRGYFVSFSPAISAKARKAVGQKIRAWHLKRRSGSDLADLAEGINPQVRGWFGYYGAFYRSELSSLAERIDRHLVRWAMHKFKRLRGRPVRAWAWFRAVRQPAPRLFAHWQMLPPTSSRPVGAV